MTIFGITLSAAVVWLVIAGLLAIIEAFTLGLTTIWCRRGRSGGVDIGYVRHCRHNAVQVIVFTCCVHHTAGRDKAGGEAQAQQQDAEDQRRRAHRTGRDRRGRHIPVYKRTGDWPTAKC